MIFENTHPAIIDRETWETAQRCRKTVRRIDHGEANPLTGLVFCADCGGKMYNHRNATKKTYISQETGKLRTRYPMDTYKCSTYSLSGKYNHAKCTQHHITTKALRMLALEAIQSVSQYAKSNEMEFVKQIREASTIRQEETAKAHKKRIVKEQKRISELNHLIRRIYEDNVKGKLTDKRFEALCADYEKEQEELEKSVVRLQSDLDHFAADNDRVDRFIDLVRRYTDITELTPTMIAEFIEKIVVHEGDWSSGEREQRVDIHLNFIGKFDVPVHEPTQEEIEAEEAARLKRSKKRETQRRWREKQKQDKREHDALIAERQSA